MVNDSSSWCEPACEMTPWGEGTLRLTKPEMTSLVSKPAHNRGCELEQENLEEEQLPVGPVGRGSEKKPSGPLPDARGLICQQRACARAVRSSSRPMHPFTTLTL